MKSITSTLSGLGFVVAREVAHTTVAALKWGTGYLPEQATTEVDSTTTQGVVLLVHGLGANKAYFRRLGKELRLAGYVVKAINYSWLRNDISACGKQVDEAAMRLMEETSSARIHIVAHSLGGVASNWALQHGNVKPYVATLITIASPHKGSPLAYASSKRMLWVGQLLTQLRPGSLELDELASLPANPGARVVTIEAELDAIVPAGYGTLDGAKNYVVTGYGHNSVPEAWATWKIVSQVLTQTT